MDLKRPSNKRDRPLSSCFESPATQKWSEQSFIPRSPSKGNPEIAEVDEVEDEELFASPVRRRKPFKNITNLVNSFETSVRSKLMSATMPFLTRSSTLVEQHLSAVKSPVQQPRKPARPPIAVLQAPPANIRRIHSMCQTSREKETCSMESNSHLQKTNISYFKVDNDLFPRIEADELKKVLAGDYENTFDEVVIVDCRFEYEFNGGHIDGAVNLMTQEDLENYFMTEKRLGSKAKRLCVFHCEFSVFRGPTMAGHLRKLDRIANSDSYPHLSYPDIVILEGGYEKFFSKHISHCIPQAYVEMKDINYQHTCEEEMNKVRKSTKLPRAKSFHQFGAKASLPKHSRSKSYTTVTSHAENLKVLKRHRSSSIMNKPTRSGSLDLKLSRASTFSHAASVFNSSPTTSPVLTVFNNIVDEDLQPPTALFKVSSQRQSTGSNYSLSCSSINSSNSSISSEHVSAFSSTDSLSDTFTSPLLEASSFFETSSLSPFNKSSGSKHSVLRSTTKKPSCPLPTIPNVPVTSPELPFGTLINHNPSNLPLTSFTFPAQKAPKQVKPQSLNRILVTKNPQPAVTSSPLISSPLSTFTPMSTHHNLTSPTHIIDPINESPVDFSVPVTNYKGSYLRRLSTDGGLHKFVTLDIDEVDEEDDGNDTTVTDIIDEKSYNE
ncbi:hypothetical protein QFC19_005855 [Naganishia cerealis]|uniref:Uncharacterized protein n=1 Tax=Naganishia cerealis TaxID=610337 RepID=A0ACC2VM39_9TREE|nr:hypothetical protein QFC19_005855 [Naganishia cerealis]